ncbi:Rho guanine nucleotide exchange factor 11, partial [Ophiophagus hannah]
MGLGSLYGENDLLELDGELQKERQVAEKQLVQLGDILSPMSFALKTYMIHMGICPQEARPASMVEKSQEKDKWLPFFPKTKKPGSRHPDPPLPSLGPQSSSGKKEKEAAVEDKKRNPILKYIAKPKSSSQSMETLRRLLLHSFLPCQDSEPEDDLTPTPSGVNHSQHRGTAPAGQGEPSEGSSTSALPGPPEPDAQGAVTGSPSWGPTRDLGPGEGLEQVGPPMAQAGTQQSETPSGYLVVRKGNCRGGAPGRSDGPWHPPPLVAFGEGLGTLA